MCHVFHHDYILKKGTNVKAVKDKLLQRLDEKAEKTKESYVANARIIERNYKAGDQTASPLAVQFARNNVASAERNLINQEQSQNRLP